MTLFEKPIIELIEISEKDIITSSGACPYDCVQGVCTGDCSIGNTVKSTPPSSPID